MACAIAGRESGLEPPVTGSEKENYDLRRFIKKWLDALGQELLDFDMEMTFVPAMLAEFGNELRFATSENIPQSMKALANRMQPAQHFPAAEGPHGNLTMFTRTLLSFRSIWVLNGACLLKEEERLFRLVDGRLGSPKVDGKIQLFSTVVTDELPPLFCNAKKHFRKGIDELRTASVDLLGNPMAIRITPNNMLSIFPATTLPVVLQCVHGFVAIGRDLLAPLTFWTDETFVKYVEEGFANSPTLKKRLDEMLCTTALLLKHPWKVQASMHHLVLELWPALRTFVRHRDSVNLLWRAPAEVSIASELSHYLDAYKHDETHAAKWFQHADETMEEAANGESRIIPATSLFELVQCLLLQLVKVLHAEKKAEDSFNVQQMMLELYRTVSSEGMTPILAHFQSSQ